MPSILFDVHQSLHLGPEEALFQFLGSLFDPTEAHILQAHTYSQMCANTNCRGLSRDISLCTGFEDTNWAKTRKPASHTWLPTRNSAISHPLIHIEELPTSRETSDMVAQTLLTTARLSPSRWLNACLKLSTSGNYTSLIVHSLWER